MHKHILLALVLGGLVAVLPLHAQRGGGHAGGSFHGGMNSHGASTGSGSHGNVGWNSSGWSGGSIGGNGIGNHARNFRSGYWHGGSEGGYWAPFWYGDDYGYYDFSQDRAGEMGPAGPPPAWNRQEEAPAPVAVAPPVKPVMMDVADMKEMPTEQPGPPTIFVFKNGERVEARRYTMTQNTLRLGDDGQKRNVALVMLDRDATVAANQQRGIQLQFPTDSNRMVLSF
jgi:hypothetical protein